MKRLLFLILVLASSIGAAQSSFKLNDKVEVLYQGKWYPAQVIEINDGKYKVHYDGYESSWDEFVGNDRIRAVEKEETVYNGQNYAYAIDDAIEGNWQGKGTWYKGKIAEKKEGKYRIQYKDGASEWTTEEFIRKEKVEQQINVVTEDKNKEAKVPIYKEGDIVEVLEKDGWLEGTVVRYSETDVMYYVKLKAGWTSRTTEDKIRYKGWPENTCSNKSTLFKVGDKIDVLWEKTGVWFDGTVLEAKDGQYLIHYIGWEDNYNEVVNNDRARKWTGEKAKTTSNGNKNGNSSGTGVTSITLKNNCSDDVIMYVNYDSYKLYKGESKTVKIDNYIYDIYSEVSGKKVLVGKANSSPSDPTVFNAICH
ncbi:MAG: agenet domain-containing protein [Crocinitomicaceae bacterium]|nr:hypothetical protein [Crocinitomicaceae bacterium]